MNIVKSALVYIVPTFYFKENMTGKIINLIRENARKHEKTITSLSLYIHKINFTIVNI